MFDSCFGDKTEDSLCKDFLLENLYIEYGAILCRNRFSNPEEVIELLAKFSTSYQPVRRDQNNNEKAEWIVYNYPIACVECSNDDIDVFNGLLETSHYFGNVQKLTYRGIELLVGNNLIIYSNNHLYANELREDITDIASILMALKYLSGSISWGLQRALSSNQQNNVSANDRKKEVETLHRKCSVFDAIFYENIFSSESKSELIREIYRTFGVERDRKMLFSARNAIDYDNEVKISKETEAVSKLVRVVGFTGLLFNMFGFCKIYGTDIVGFTIGSLDAYKYLAITLFITFLLFCAMSCLYHSFDVLELALHKLYKKKAIKITITFIVILCCIMILVILFGFWGITLK